MCNCNSIALQLQWVSLHKCCILLSCLESPLRTMRRFILLILNSHFQSHIMLHCIVLHYFALHCPLLCQVGLHIALDPTVILAPHQQCIEWCWITTYQACCPITHPSPNTNWILPPLCWRGTAEAKFYPLLWQNEPWVANHIVVSQGTLWPTNGSRWPVLKPLPRSEMWYLPNSSESYDLSITCQWLVPWPGLWLWSSWKIGLSGPLYSHSS